MRVPRHCKGAVILEDHSGDIFDTRDALLTDGGTDFLTRYTFTFQRVVDELSVREDQRRLAIYDARGGRRVDRDLGEHYLNRNEHRQRNHAFDERSILADDGRRQDGPAGYDKNKIEDVELGERSLAGAPQHDHHREESERA